MRSSGGSSLPADMRASGLDCAAVRSVGLRWPRRPLCGARSTLPPSNLGSPSIQLDCSTRKFSVNTRTGGATGCLRDSNRSAIVPPLQLDSASLKALRRGQRSQGGGLSMEFDEFGPIADDGWTTSGTAQKYTPTFELNSEICTGKLWTSPSRTTCCRSTAISTITVLL